MNTSSILIKSLQNPRLFPHKIEYFKLIETHISWVLLTGEYAYKIKKPLNLGFLDFSSLEKRHHYCLEELRLDSRLAPELYLNVIAIYGTAEQPTLDESGAVIEYAVKMNQFQPHNTFDQLLVQHKLTDEHIKQTAKIIAAFHNKIERADVATEFGNAKVVMLPVRENFSQLQKLDGLDTPTALKLLASWCEEQHTALLAFFKQRKHTGFIRECHGDLHLGNIALIGGQIVPFDGIEFNPSLYWIDVISEIAFLVMDLQEKQRDDLAFQFLNEYLQHSGDYEGLKVLRFYLVYRAMVRAKVSALCAVQSSSSAENRQAITSYHRYLQLAERYTQSFTPLMILLYGVSGSGKSWLSEQIINRYQFIRIRSDVERKRLYKLSPQQQSHSAVGENLYSQKSSDMTYEHLLNLSVDILNTGYPVIVDATFLLRQQRKLFCQQAKQRHVPFLIVHTQSDKQTLLKRIKERCKFQNNVSEANEDVLEVQFQSMQPLNDDELKNSITINTDKDVDLTRFWKHLADYFHAGTAK